MKKFVFSILILVLIPFAASAEMVINKFDLTWSTDTYTPFDYSGRALPVAGSKIIVNAIVSASNGSPSNLKYSWFLEDIFQQNKSGYGKDSFYFYAQKNSGSFHTVRLQIFNEDRSIFEEQSIQIPITSPEIVVCPSSGNAHFSNQENKTYNLSSGEKFSLIARPYFFSANKLTDLKFEWTAPGQEPIISSEYDASVLNLKIEKKVPDVFKGNIWVNVTSKIEEAQKAFKSININIY